jgi:succinate-semialdehyde dehydrogenase/glutarate-semialdehyde dehydrogenase
VYEVVNPATGRLVERYPSHSDEQVADAVDLSYACYESSWSRIDNLMTRVDVLRSAAEELEARREELAQTITVEMGKKPEEALGEVDFSAEILRYYADNAATFIGDQVIAEVPGGSALVRPRPLGPILGIMPWNYPYYQIARFAAPNLALGNTVLLKPAPQCPASSALVHTILENAGAPAGAYQTLRATNEQIANVIEKPVVRGVSVTGSERAGAAVAAMAGAHLKKVVLELGGSDPFILLSTDDIEGAVAAASTARLENSGQACNAAKRFIVLDTYYDEFLEHLGRRFAAAAPDLAPLSSAAAADNLRSQIGRAVDDGAKVQAFGENNAGAFVGPVILTDLTNDSAVLQEEFFGPVAIVIKAASEADAIRIANATPFGLGSYVFSTDEDQVNRVAERLDCGMVFINGVGLEAANLPFGGMKRSGTGRELGRPGFFEFANLKVIRSV